MKNYLKNYLFKINHNTSCLRYIYYSKWIEHFNIDQEKKIFLDKLYMSNNICESLNSKLLYI